MRHLIIGMHPDMTQDQAELERLAEALRERFPGWDVTIIRGAIGAWQFNTGPDAGRCP